MWNVPHLIQIQKARHALRSGNLDEAFAIATLDSLRDYRQCREILEGLIEPFLARARAHFAAGRNEDALADVERAQRAGGNRPAVAELRDRILAERAQDVRHKQAAREVLDSARQHIEAGRLANGAERLAAAPAEEAARLRKRLDQRAREADEARTRTEECLARGDVEGALAAAEILKAVAGGESDTRAILDRLAAALPDAVARALTAGALVDAQRLVEHAARMNAAMADVRRWRDTIETAEKTARAVARGDWPEALVQASRLERFLPDAWWAAQAHEQLMMVEEALRGLRAGPLGDRLTSAAARAPLHVFTTVGLDTPPPPAGAHAPCAPPKEPAPEGRGGAGCERCLLWVDGVGSFLLLAPDCVTIGRAGSSARPDIALSADIEGVHAQVLRVDHEYFLAPRGPVTVNGASVSRRLLADGDQIVLGGRSALTFRLPTALSSTAMLDLPAGLQLARDVSRVILLDQHLVFGPRGRAHIAAAGLAERVVLSLGANGFRCRAHAPLVVGGAPRGRDAEIPLGVPVEAGPLTFTLTSAPREGGRP